MDVVEESAAQTPVDVTVLLATRNRADLLATTLDRLTGLRTDGLRWQLVVVDNGSTDATSRVLSAAARRLPLLAVQEPVPGKNRALNTAVPRVRGELLAFIDDDILVPPEWLTSLADAARRWPGTDVFAGRILPVFPPETPAWMRQHDFGRAAFGRFDLDQPEGPTDQYGFGGNLVIRTAVVRAHRFDEGIGPGTGRDYAMGSETEYLRRLRRAGHRTTYVPTLIVEHIIEPHQTTPAWLRARSYRLGRGLCRMGIARVPRLDRALGWPLRLSWQTMKAALRYQATSWVRPSTAFDAGLRYHYLRGVRDEVRTTWRRTRPGAETADP